jgi:hypothetical protein
MNMPQFYRNEPPRPYVSRHLLSHEEVSALPRQDLRFDWYGAAVNPPMRYSLAFDPESIWLWGERGAPPQCDMSLALGTFVEGLWKAEVIELFLSEDRASSTRYREFNLSPVGAWWSACFSSYRTVTSEISDDALKEKTICWSSSKDAPHAWNACLKVPVGALGIYINGETPPRLNVTAIVPVPGAAEPHYLSAHAFQGEPDFHLVHQISK